MDRADLKLDRLLFVLSCRYSSFGHSSFAFLRMHHIPYLSSCEEENSCIVDR